MVRVGEPRWASEATAAVSLVSPSPFPPPLHLGTGVPLLRAPRLKPLPFSVRSENNCFLYGVFNGYDGSRVTSFVAQRLSAELLLGQLSAEHTEADVRRVLLQVAGVRLADRDPGRSAPPGAQPCDRKVRGQPGLV